MSDNTQEISIEAYIADAGNTFGTAVANAVYQAIENQIDVEALDGDAEAITTFSEQITDEVLNDMEPDINEFAQDFLGDDNEQESDGQVIADYASSLKDDIGAVVIEWVTATVALRAAGMGDFAPHENLIQRAILGVFAAEITDGNGNEPEDADADDGEEAEDDDNFIEAPDEDDDNDN